MPKNDSVFRSETSRVIEDRLRSIPFVYVQRRQDGYEVRGQVECSLGHRIQRSDGRDDGIYASWSWDGMKLVVENDRYGFYPMFYFADENRVCVSPIIARLVAEGAGRSVDDAAMAVFLRLGYMIGEATPFRQIRCLPPDAIFEWSVQGFEVKGRRAIPPHSTLSREAALEGFIELFQDAMLRRPPIGKSVLPLSGGRDSRHIFFELCRRGWNPDHCVSVDMPHEQDVVVATQLTKSQDVPLRIIAPTEPALESEVRKNLETSFCSDEHTWALGMADYLAQNAECTWDGIAGDVLSSSRSINAQRQQWFESGDFGSLAINLMGTNDKFTTAALPPSVRARWSSELAIDEIRSEMKCYSEAANPVAAFMFWNRTRREIALYSYGFLRNTGYVYAPFLDHDLFDHLASLPAAMQLDRKLHDDAIRRGYPEGADIPYASKTGQSPFGARALSGFANATLRLLMKAEHKSWVGTSFFGLRLLRSRLQASRREDGAYLGSRSVYMLQLEDIVLNGLDEWT